MDIIVLTIFIILITGIFVVKTYSSVNKKNETVTDKVTDKVIDNGIIKPNINNLSEFYKDIKLQPYGCFSSLDEKFFKKHLNIYNNTYDSLLVINENNTEADIKNLVLKVINNGYDIYGFKILHKYDAIENGYKKISIQEIAILGKLAGYNYLSIYKINLNTRGKIYLSYSEPMDQLTNKNENITKSDLPKHTLTPKLNNYTNEEEKAENKELSCGYPCLPDGKPETFKDPDGTIRQYMCGSVGYPNIKTPTRFAVYKIVETT